MPGTKEKLAQAAKKRPSHEWAKTCHATVFSWMITAGYVDEGRYLKLFAGIQNHQDVYRQILAQQAKDRVVRKDGVKDIKQGAIIGFYQGEIFQHSMVALGNSSFAGVRNGNVATIERQETESVNDYAEIKNDDLWWNDKGQQIGLANYEMYQEDPEAVAKRINDFNYEMYRQQLQK